MTIAIIDIGSNSVRLMLWADGKTLFKKLKSTRLGEGLSFAPRLLPEACERTAQAVAEFVKDARLDGAERVYAFATAAVRCAENGAVFTNMVMDTCGLEVDVLSGEREAQMGLCGALGNSDGGIIDVGGASTEVTLRVNGKITYSHSAPIGTVRILDASGRNLENIKKFIAERTGAYGEHDFSQYKMYAVGGTATRLAAIRYGITEYDAQALHGRALTLREVEHFSELLTQMSVEEIRRTTICTKSADLIGGGAALLAAVMKHFKVGEITVSDSDNLEGYALSLTDL